MVHFKLMLHLGEFQAVLNEKEASEISINMLLVTSAIIVYLQLIACDSLQNTGYIF